MNIGVLIVAIITFLVGLYFKWKIYRLNHFNGITWDNKPWNESEYQSWIKKQKEGQL